MAKRTQQELVIEARDLLEQAAVAEPGSSVQQYVEIAVTATDAALLESDATKTRGYEGQFVTRKADVEGRSQ